MITLQVNCRRMSHEQAVVLCGIACGLGRPACRADTVYLTDGTEANGTIIEENASTVVLRLDNGTLRSYRRDDVDVIVHEKKAPGAQAAPNNEPVEPAAAAEPEAKPKPDQGAAGSRVAKKSAVPSQTPKQPPQPRPDNLIKVGSAALPLEGSVWVTADGKEPDMRGRVHLIEFWFAG